MITSVGQIADTLEANLDSQNILDSIARAYCNTAELGIRGSNPAEQQKKRIDTFTRAVIDNLAPCLRTLRARSCVEIFSKTTIPPPFRRSGLVYDVYACEVEYRDTPVEQIKLPVIKRSIVQMKMEFDSSHPGLPEVISNLPCAKSEIKILIVTLPFRMEDYLASLKKIAAAISGKFFVVSLTHPDTWEERSRKRCMVSCFSHDVWIHRVQL